MSIERITCVQFFGEFPDFCSRLVLPDYGLPLIGTILSQAGYDVKVYVERIEPPAWERVAASDLLCFSSMCAGADKMRRFAQRVRSKHPIPIVVGGVHASYFPELCLQYCDYVVIGEGDETILELVGALEDGAGVEKVPGIAFRNGGRVCCTPARPGPSRFDTIPDYSLIEGYSRMGPLGMLMQRKKPWLTVQSSRGCPFNCSFCIVSTMFPGGYRTRGVDSVIRDMRDKRPFGRQLVFVDNEFAADRSYAKKLLRRIIREDFGFRIVVFARVEVAEDDELLDLMRQAGVTHVYQGYESLLPETLAAYNKRQHLGQIKAAISKLHARGFGILASFVMGGDGDNLETTRRTVDFVIEQGLFNAYFWPIMGYFPEKRFGYQTILPQYRSIFLAWKYYDGHFVTHFPLNMSPSQLQRALIDAYRSIYAPPQILAAIRRRKFADAQAKIFLRYLWRDIEREVRAYLPFLEQIEEGLYDPEGRLREDLLQRRVAKNPRWTFQAATRPVPAAATTPPRDVVAEKENLTCLSRDSGKRER